MSRTRKPPKKSKSEQLRAVLFRIYQKKQPMIEFDEYYDQTMEKLIDKYKLILNKL